MANNAFLPQVRGRRLPAINATRVKAAPANLRIPSPEFMPIKTSVGVMMLRLISKNDGERWSTLRRENYPWLHPWEPTCLHWEKYHSPQHWKTLYRHAIGLFKEAKFVPLAILVDGVLVGQVTLGNITRGAVSSAWIGYWVDHALWGHNIATLAAKQTTQFAFEVLKVHRLEATVQAQNVASIRVLQKLGMSYEGTLREYMHVNGQWRDHQLWAVVAS